MEMAYKRQRGKFLRFITQPEVAAFLWTAVALFLTAILVTFHSTDPSWLYYTTETVVTKNIFGAFGAQCAAALFYAFGYVSFLLPLLCAVCACSLWIGRLLSSEIDRLFASLVLIPTVSALFYFYQLGTITYLLPGGRVGQFVYLALRSRCDQMVTLFILLTLLFVCVVLLSRHSFFTVFSFIAHAIKSVFVHWRVWVGPLIAAVKKGTNAFYGLCVFAYQKIAQRIHPINAEEMQALQTFEPAEGQTQFERDEFWQQYFDKNENGQEVMHHQSPAIAISLPEGGIENKILETFSKKDVQQVKKPYVLPSLKLLAPTVKDDNYAATQNHKQMSQALEEKLARFGITGTVVSVRPGPVITLFEYEPDIDAKVSRILSLSDDLALALEAVSVRIIAPIPGTSRVGFEVANKERKPVFLRDILRSATFQKSHTFMPLVLGKDTAGDEVIADMGDMPHLLVAGSTGSGKSVALNTLLISLLYKLTPEQLRLVIIDPKRLEFAAYQNIPHLLFPIVTDALRAAPVLHWLVRTMEERYEKMAQSGARSIADYNKICELKGEQSFPYIVLIIDELADLMMIARREVEDNIARLAQMARAAGIHLIVATQRPSVDVITGVIKVNFPSRMSFRVTSKVDSRTVLDALGAEALLGKGDMLFLDAHSARMRRIHGAYVTDAEITAIADHVRAQRQPDYISLEDAVAAYNSESDDNDEPILKEVIMYLETIDEISISLLQRRFKIGYNRSARIIELLEAQGRILPSSGGKTRKVIH